MKRLMFNKIIAICLSVIMMGSSVLYMPSSWATEINLAPEKHETVYVNLYPDGRRRNVIDSTWIQNSRGLKEFKDNTVLKQVESVSGAKLIKNDNGNLVWDTNGDDVYYQSPVEKAVPVDVEISYFMNGKKMSPEQIAGKSGRAKIHIKLKNNDRHEDLFTPFMAVAVIPLKNEVFTDVSVTDGKIFSDGNSKMVICIGFPSLEEMLDFESENIDPLKDLDFPDEFTIEADVKEFELSTIGIAISPQIPDAIKDMTNDEDIEQDLKDIDTIIESKDTIEQVDPKETLKKFVRSNNKIKRSRDLINDLYDFYDLDTSILEELPEFVTHENIELLDKLKDDAKKYYAEDMLDNEVIRNIPKRLNANNISKAEKLIKWHDEFKKFDDKRLDEIDIMIANRSQLEKVMDEAEDLVDSAKSHEEEFDALKSLSGIDLQVKQLIRDLEKSELVNALSGTPTSGSAISAADIVWMKNQLINKKTTDITAQKMAEITFLLNNDGALNPAGDPPPNDVQKQFLGIVQKGVASGAITSGAAIGMKNAIMADRITLIPAVARNSIKTMMKPVVQNKVKQGVQKKVNSVMGEGRNIGNQIGAIKSQLRRELGPDYKGEIEHSLHYMSTLRKRMKRLKDLGDKYEYEIEQAKDVLHDKDTLDYVDEWKDKLEDARDDIDMNDENIEIMRDLINEYKKPKVKILYDHIPELLDDIDALRPVATRFNDMLEKPRNDKIIHDMPETLPILIRMRKDILNSRDITDTLALGTDKRVINAARKVLDVIDAQDQENRLEKMRDELESVNNILDKKDRLIELSDNYNTFAGKTNDIKSNVSFILKTDSIEVPEEPKEKVEQNSGKDDEKSGSFVDWVKSLFAKLFAMLNFWSA